MLETLRGWTAGEVRDAPATSGMSTSIGGRSCCRLREFGRSTGAVKEEDHVSTKADYTKEEWELLVRSPLMAAMAVVAASPSGPIGALKEMFAVGKGVLEGAEGTTNPLIGALVADIKAGARPATAAEAPRDLAQAKSQALGACREVAALLGRKAPGEADGFKRWLLGSAQRAAEAAKEGGFLGIGGVQVSDAEKSALAEVAQALGVKA
jgi:hypothetical protein